MSNKFGLGDLTCDITKDYYNRVMHYVAGSYSVSRASELAREDVAQALRSRLECIESKIKNMSWVKGEAYALLTVIQNAKISGKSLT